MSANNSFNCIGNLTRDPEARNAGGKVVAQFSLAVDGWKKDEVHYFDFEAWEQTATFMMDNLVKGDKVSVQGEAKQDRWEDKTSGDKRSKVLFTVRDLKAIRVKKWDDKRNAESGGGGDPEGDAAPDPRVARNKPPARGRAPEPAPFDDDLNF